MASWREKYREQIKEFGPEYVNLNVPVENENPKKSKGRPKYRDTFEDMPFYNPVAVSLMKPYYGNFPLENSKDFYTNDKLYQKLKDDKKEFVDQQKDPAIREMLYKISDKHQKSTNSCQKNNFYYIIFSFKVTWISLQKKIGKQ